MSGSGVSKYGCVLSSSGTSGNTSVGWRDPRNFKHLRGRREEEHEPAAQRVLQRSHRRSRRVLLPDRVAVGGILVEVLEQLQQSQLDALFGGDVGVTQQFMESFSDVSRRVLGTDTNSSA